MTGKRKRYSVDFRAKVALEALKGELTLSQLATKHGVHQTMIAARRGASRPSRGFPSLAPHGEKGAAELRREGRYGVRD